MKHVVATNMILWLRTLIKESVEEIIELQKELLHDVSLVRFTFINVNIVIEFVYSYLILST